MSKSDTPATTGDLHAERKDYQQDQLNRNQLSNNPVELFAAWMQDARDQKILDATAMTLATCSREGRPSARIVLLKLFSEEGFCWYTNYESRKAADLAENNNAALLFYWRDLERQVRIEGSVEKVSEQLSDEYFQARPEGSRYSAAASPQSQVVPDQQWLARRTEEIQQQYPVETLERPSFWGGYRLIPQEFEFWQGRPSRLHDRFRYQRTADKTSWKIDRLAP